MKLRGFEKHCWEDPHPCSKRSGAAAPHRAMILDRTGNSRTLVDRTEQNRWQAAYMCDSHISPQTPSMAVNSPPESPPGGALLTAPGPMTGRPHFGGPMAIASSAGLGLHTF